MFILLFFFLFVSDSEFLFFSTYMPPLAVGACALVACIKKYIFLFFFFFFWKGTKQPMYRRILCELLY